MLALYIAQIVVPLALIGWIALAPQRSLAGFWVQVIATAAGLIALARTGLWLFPPWWTPYASGLLLVAAMGFALRRRPPATRWPSGLRAYAVIIGFALLGMFATNMARLALAGAQQPAGPSIALASSLGAGQYLVANGGASTLVNAHADILDQSVPAHRNWRGTAYGVDLVAIDSWGLRADGVMPPDPSRYHIFGMPVVSPCAGEVIAAVDGLPDMQVPKVDAVNLAGNHIILRCGGTDVVLAHFQRGSVQVRTGERLAVGAPIALVGNSGGSSEPHLHIHAQAPADRDAPLSGEPIPMTLGGRFLVRSDQFSP
ncbi:MAG: M23 family metallopeptidase [Sphingopyxis sp.]|nr:M23 family metallopeptidase [Sphingopyxis sp.]